MCVSELAACIKASAAEASHNTLLIPLSSQSFLSERQSEGAAEGELLSKAVDNAPPFAGSSSWRSCLCYVFLSSFFYARSLLSIFTFLTNYQFSALCVDRVSALLALALALASLLLSFGLPSSVALAFNHALRVHLTLHSQIRKKLTKF